MSQETPGCLGIILRLFGQGGTNTSGPDTSPGSVDNYRFGQDRTDGTAPDAGAASVDAYRLRDDFLSPAEASFFRVLRLVAAEQYLVFPKVRLADLFFVSRPNENRGAANRIAQRHVDFVLCDPLTLKPLCGLELDDASHRKAANAERDRFKDEVFAAVGLPLVRVPVQPGYQPGQVAALLASALPPGEAGNHLSSAPATAPQDRDTSDSTPPLCPKCAVPMVLRTAQRGDNRGSQFWGCVNYPKCRQVISPANDLN